MKFTISFPQRTYPSVQYAKQVLDSGELGTVSLVRLRNAHSGASANWLPDYWYIEKDACGGSMMDLGCPSHVHIRLSPGKACPDQLYVQ